MCPDVFTEGAKPKFRWDGSLYADVQRLIASDGEIVAVVRYAYEKGWSLGDKHYIDAESARAAAEKKAGGDRPSDRAIPCPKCQRPVERLMAASSPFYTCPTVGCCNHIPVTRAAPATDQMTDERAIELLRTLHAAGGSAMTTNDRCSIGAALDHIASRLQAQIKAER